MTFTQVLKTLKVHPLVDAKIPKSAYLPLDLSICNSELRGVDVSSSEHLERFIWNKIKSNKAKVAYGGYLEPRGIYRRSAYFNQENLENDRNIHIGLDLWIDAGTAIFAPLDGTIHSFKNNTNNGDYGPTIILKHSIEDYEFYTLYGHLSLASLDDKKVGVSIKQGEQLATLGTAEVNGDYPPHLHFQIIKDIQGYVGDYPGVCSKSDLNFYLDNGLDPSMLLGLE